MKSSYKVLGSFIEPVNQLNDGMEVKELLGISNQKFFQNSHTNTIGIDLQTYRIVRTNQFAYNRATTRNGDKISIALRQGNDCIVSPSYRIFRSKNENLLNSEYLMMWFCRPEFDRYARFKSHGSAHEFFEYDQMCQVELPIPSITKQREIVKEYNVIQSRIALNQQLIQKLEEAAQAIYKQWFVEFEFPTENGKPYRSNGGEMVWNEELQTEIPRGWECIIVKDFCTDMKSGGTPSRINPEYWNSNDVPWLKTGEIKNNIILSTEEYISNEGLKNSSAKLLPKDTVLMSMYGVNAGEIGSLQFEASTNQACCGMICKNSIHSAYLYFHLLHNQEFISSQSIGGAQENLSKDYVEKIPILKPLDEILEMKALKIIIDNKEVMTSQIQKLTELKNLVLSKLATIEN